MTFFPACFRVIKFSSSFGDQTEKMVLEISRPSVNDHGHSFREHRRVAGPPTDTLASAREGVATVSRLEVQADDIGCVQCVQFCPYSGAEQLLVTGSDQHGKLSLFRVRVSHAPVTHATSITSAGRLSCDRLQDIEMGDDINCISWSPESQCDGLVATVKLAVSLFNQKEVHIVTVRLKHRSLLLDNAATEQSPMTDTTAGNEASGGEGNDSSSKISNKNDEVAEVEHLERQVCEQLVSDLHQSTPVTDVAFEPNQGLHLASVGQEKLCCVWDVRDLRMICLFKLTSAGQSVRWCPTDPDRLLVGEQCGIIRIYDLPSKTPLMSFSTFTTSGLLACADWCRTNPLLIAASVGSETLFWQTSHSSLPVDQIPSNHKGTEQLAMYNDHLYATRGRPRSQVLVYNRRLGQLLLDEQVKAGAGLSWHAKSPVLALGGYRKLVLFQLNAYT